MFGPANGSLWWQINEERIDPDRVLLGLVIFIDEYFEGSTQPTIPRLAVCHRYLHIDKLAAYTIPND